MPTSTQELQSFQQYAAARIQNGAVMLELDDLLDEWKHQNPDPKQLQEDVLAVKAALQAMASGDTGRPAEEVVREIRTKYKLAKE